MAGAGQQRLHNMTAVAAALAVAVLAGWHDCCLRVTEGSP